MCNLLSRRTNRTFFDALNNFDLVYFLLFLPAFTHLFIVLLQQKTHFCLPTKVRFLNDVCQSSQSELYGKMMLASPNDDGYA